MTVTAICEAVEEVTSCMPEETWTRTPTCQHLLNMPGYWTCQMPQCLIRASSTINGHIHNQQQPLNREFGPLSPIYKSSPTPMGPPTPVWFLPYHLSDFTFYYNITGLPTPTDLPWLSQPHKLISWVARFLWEHLLMSFYMDASAFRNIKCNLGTRLCVTDSRSMNSAKWAVSCY